jgi:FkbM family methyltransferase
VIDISDSTGWRRIRISDALKIYKRDLERDFDHYFSAVVPVDALCSVVDYSEPRLHWLRRFDDFPVMCPSLAEPYSTYETYLRLCPLHLGDNVLDLGAYNAVSSITFSKAVGPTGRVVAVEPDPLNISAARWNLDEHWRVNKLENITLFQRAIAGQRGVIQFSSEGCLGSAAVSTVGNRGDVVSVESFTVSDAAIGLDHVELVKMDIEGSEVDALGASFQFLRDFRPSVIVEPHPIKGTVCTDDVRRILEAYGHQTIVVDQPGQGLPLVVGKPTYR